MNTAIALILAILIGILVLLIYTCATIQVMEGIITNIYFKIQISEALLTRIHNKMENSKNP